MKRVIAIIAATVIIVAGIAGVVVTAESEEYLASYIMRDGSRQYLTFRALDFDHAAEKAARRTPPGGTPASLQLWMPVWAQTPTTEG